MKSSVFAITVLTVAAIGGLTSTGHAAQKKVFVPVIKGAKALSVSEKGGIVGMGRKVVDPCVPVPDPCIPPPPPDPCDPPPPPDPCDPPPPPDPCDPPPPPDPCDPPATKPGYGFGTSGHHGPPGQGFTSANTWRGVVAGGGRRTPKGHSLPPRAFR